MIFTLKSLLAGVLLLAAKTFGQSYPTKLIRLIVPFPPGGPAVTDLMGGHVDAMFATDLVNF